MNNNILTNIKFDNQISDDDVWSFVYKYFEENSLISHQLNSFNYFINKLLPDVISQNNEITIKNKNDEIDCVVKFGAYYLDPPVFVEKDNEERKIYPTEARNRGISYNSKLSIDVIIIRYFPQEERSNPKRICIGYIPVMVGSELCNLSKVPLSDYYKYGECPKTLQGYFIEKGACKVVIPQARTNFNQPYLFANRSKTPCFKYYADIRSSATNGYHTTTSTIGYMKDGRLYALIPYINEKTPIPVGVLFKAIGAVDEEEIVKFINEEYLYLFESTLEHSYPIRTQEQALIYIGSKKKKTKKEIEDEENEDNEEDDESIEKEEVKEDIEEIELDNIGEEIEDEDIEDPEEKNDDNIVVDKEVYEDDDDDVDLEEEVEEEIVKKLSKKDKKDNMFLTYAKHLVNKEFLPHIGSNPTTKLYYLGNMINKILKICHEKKQYKYSANDKKWAEIEKELLSDRDDCANKIIDAAGSLLQNLFYVSWKKMKNECKLACEKILEKGNRVVDPIKNIKQSTITQRLAKCLATGNWGNKNSKKDGVSQQYDPFNHIGALSMMRKVSSSIGTTGKVYEPRKAHPSTYGLLCVFETPEGKPCGLILYLAMSTHISIGHDSAPIIEILNKFDHILTFDKINKNNNLQKRIELKQKLLKTPNDKKLALSLKKLSEEPNDVPSLIDHVIIAVNGIWVGIIQIQDVLTIYNTLKKMKQTNSIDFTTEIVYKKRDKLLCINTNSGRLMRPLFVVKDGKLVATKEDLDKINDGSYSFGDLLQKGIVEFLSAGEQNMNEKVANYPSEIYRETDPNRFTYCEIHPSMICGVGTSTVPFPNHNQAPRNTYQSAMAKQAIGILTTNYRKLMKNMQILLYPQKPIVSSKLAKITKYEELPSGQNATTFIFPFTGFNQEDSLILNMSSTQAGFGNSMYCTHFTSVDKKEDNVIYGIPSQDKYECLAFKCKRTDHLNVEGIVKIGSIIHKGDPLICRYQKTANNKFMNKVVANSETIEKGVELNKVKKEKITDISIIFNHDEVGTVESIQVGVNSEGYNYITVKVIILRIPIIGDKFSSRYGQKGTCGFLYNREDLPFTLEGIVPDIMINSLAIPSRMTIGQLLESCMGKKCCSTNKNIPQGQRSTIHKDMKNYPKDFCKGDSTPFVGTSELENTVSSENGGNNKDEESEKLLNTEWSKMTKNLSLRKVFDTLKKHGYSYDCNERLINGMTGEMIEADIFVGPTYYQRLKHQVIDKVHARARGNVQKLTRQPNEGRANDGGLREGEMERDQLIASGTAAMINDRLFKCSDEYHVYVCNICGGFAINKLVNKEVQAYCKVCETKDISYIPIPYVTKLLNHYLQGMNIFPRILASKEN
jgi:DNA-directed RNA polymerase II subunit RPB2